MATIQSTMIPLGCIAANFSLPDTINQAEVSLPQINSHPAVVIMFICNHCPYVIHIRQELINVATEYIAKGIKFIAISSNDIEKYPEDGPEKMKEFAVQYGFPFPYLFDKSQQVAKDYDAQCTPDFFIFDRELSLVYRGQFDNSRPGNGINVSGNDIKNALNSILIGKEINPIQMPSIGCNIKWK